MPVWTPTDLAGHLQHDLDTATAEIAFRLATAHVRAYTRGKGFDPVTGEPVEEIGAVILGVAARLYANPELLKAETVGDVGNAFAVSGFQGFTLAEQTVLNGHRRRAA